MIYDCRAALARTCLGCGSDACGEVLLSVFIGVHPWFNGLSPRPGVSVQDRFLVLFPLRPSASSAAKKAVVGSQ
jgi:hypothetical protein